MPHKLSLLGVALALVSIACGRSASPSSPQRPGSLGASVTITGDTTDPNGFTATLDGGSPKPVLPGHTTLITGVTPGGHTIQLGDIAPPCLVSGSNPRAVTVTEGDTTYVSFGVTCTAPPPTTGTLSMSVNTSGVTPDPDGYSYSLDGAAPAPLAANGVTSVPGIAAGVHSLAISGVASHCSPSAPLPTVATITAGQTTTLTIAVLCAVNLKGYILYTSDRTGPQHLDSLELWAMRPDGTNRFRITTNAIVDASAQASPDGTHLVYAAGPVLGQAHLFAANADGSSPIELTTGAQAGHPRWSPDGTHILYSRALPGTATLDAIIINADGTNPQMVGPGTTPSVFHRASPVWSPNGGRIAFATDSSINLIDPSGANEITIYKGTVSSLDWSWATGRLVFAGFSLNDPANGGDDDIEIFTFDSTGSNVHQVTAPPSCCHAQQAPVWSPQGDAFVFTRQVVGTAQSQVWKANADGGNAQALTTDGFFNSDPTWR